MTAGPRTGAGEAALPGLCLDCTSDPGDGRRCRRCGSPRLVRHAELHDLRIAHLDCDAFYASIEKRDDPSLTDRPLIIGGSRRGVVSTACYIARIRGVKSAMPMFQALKLCPDAVVLPPDMKKYAAVGRQIREMMQALTPLVEPLSIDEAFLDLSGTAALHRASPATILARFVKRLDEEVGISASIGLAPNKFLAKMASDLDKPRGFSVIGAAEAKGFLAGRPVSAIWGVGPALQQRLTADGLRTVGDLQRADPATLARRYGAMGLRLGQLAHGEDARKVTPDRAAKSISSETTFDEDVADPETLSRTLWRLSEKVAARLKAAQLSGRTVTLKLKTPDFRTLSRSHGLGNPTRLAHRLFEEGERLLAAEADGRRAFRLIGIGATDLVTADAADLPDLLDQRPAKLGAAEAAIDRLRDRFGADLVQRGIGFTPRPKKPT